MSVLGFVVGSVIEALCESVDLCAERFACAAAGPVVVGVVGVAVVESGECDDVRSECGALLAGECVVEVGHVAVSGERGEVVMVGDDHVDFAVAEHGLEFAESVLAQVEVGIDDDAGFAALGESHRLCGFGLEAGCLGRVDCAVDDRHVECGRGGGREHVHGEEHDGCDDRDAGECACEQLVAEVPPALTGGQCAQYGDAGASSVRQIGGGLRRRG